MYMVRGTGLRAGPCPDGARPAGRPRTEGQRALVAEDRHAAAAGAAEAGVAARGPPLGSLNCIVHVALAALQVRHRSLSIHSGGRALQVVVEEPVMWTVKWRDYAAVAQPVASCAAAEVGNQ